jgi:hypothetical protein
MKPPKPKIPKITSDTKITWAEKDRVEDLPEMPKVRLHHKVLAIGALSAIHTTFVIAYVLDAVKEAAKRRKKKNGQTKV